MMKPARYFTRLPPLAFRRSLSSNLRFNTGEKNYYTILKITPNASQEDIKKAYYKLSKLYHPDRNQSEEAHDKFTAINEAYNVLGNVSERRQYDRGLSINHGPSLNVKRASKRQDFHGKRIVYDFDDWTQKYHEEAMKRRRRHSAMKKQFEERHVSDDVEKLNRNVILTAVLTLIGVAVMANGKKDSL